MPDCMHHMASAASSATPHSAIACLACSTSVCPELHPHCAGSCSRCHQPLRTCRQCAMATAAACVLVKHAAQCVPPCLLCSAASTIAGQAVPLVSILTGVSDVAAPLVSMPNDFSLYLRLARCSVHLLLCCPSVGMWCVFTTAAVPLTAALVPVSMQGSALLMLQGRGAMLQKILGQRHVTFVMPMAVGVSMCLFCIRLGAWAFLLSCCAGVSASACAMMMR